MIDFADAIKVEEEDPLSLIGIILDEWVHIHFKGLLDNSSNMRLCNGMERVLGPRR